MPGSRQDCDQPGKAEHHGGCRVAAEWFTQQRKRQCRCEHGLKLKQQRGNAGWQANLQADKQEAELADAEQAGIGQQKPERHLWPRHEQQEWQ